MQEGNPFDSFPKNRFYISPNGKVQDSYQDCINLVKKFSTPIRKKSQKNHVLSEILPTSFVKKCGVKVDHIFPGAQGASFGQMSHVELNHHKLNHHKLNRASLENDLENNSENNHSQTENEIVFKMEKAVSENAKEIEMESVKPILDENQAYQLPQTGYSNKTQTHSQMLETVTNVQTSQGCQDQPNVENLQDIGFVWLSEMSGSYASLEMTRPLSNDAQMKKSEGLVNGFVRKSYEKFMNFKKTNFLFL